MTRVNAFLFVNGAQIDLNQISEINHQLKRKLVLELFNKDIISHENSHAYDLNASFSSYYKSKERLFRLIDLNRDGNFELIFQGYTDSSDDREFTEIYANKNGKYDLIYRQVGYIMAYKIQANTKEIVLFQHQYPCCSALSHNIYTLRYLNKQIKEKSKLFLGRSLGMAGNFFPDTCQFGTKFKKLTKKTLLYWSDSIIEKNATSTISSNKIIHYPKGSVYQVLATHNEWSYILIRGEALDEKSEVVNAQNISKMSVFAWIRN